MHHSRARRVSHRFRLSLSLSPFHIMRAIKEGDRGAWLAGTRACTPAPLSPARPHLDFRGPPTWGCWVSPVSGICPLPFSFPAVLLWVAALVWCVCLPPAPLPSHSHTHSLTRPANSLKHPLSHISEHSRTRGPFHISPKFKPSVPRDKSPHKWHTRAAAHPHNVAAAGRRPAFYRKDIVSHILPCPQHRLKTVDPGPSPERNKPHRLLHRHVPGGARLPTQGGAPAQY